MNKILCLLLGVTVSVGALRGQDLLSQSVTVSGTVLDADTQRPVPAFTIECDVRRYERKMRLLGLQSPYVTVSGGTFALTVKANLTSHTQPWFVSENNGQLTLTNVTRSSLFRPPFGSFAGFMLSLTVTKPSPLARCRWMVPTTR